MYVLDTNDDYNINDDMKNDDYDNYNDDEMDNGDKNTSDSPSIKISSYLKKIIINIYIFIFYRYM